MKKKAIFLRYKATKIKKYTFFLKKQANLIDIITLYRVYYICNLRHIVNLKGGKNV